ncbi:hypothetical protein GH807_16935, partial [Acetobacterium tundrae]|nr:hypothetical protein [Acetobacterium tundrae]MBC3798691.1 hypothetical protein [Acetobacterium tundrae]
MFKKFKRVMALFLTFMMLFSMSGVDMLVAYAVDNVSSAQEEQTPAVGGTAADGGTIA